MDSSIGDQIGPFKLLAYHGKSTWTVQCKCSNQWTTRKVRFKNRTNCPSCKPKRSFKHRKAGDIINGNILLERLPSRKWKAQCKCGATRVCSPCDLERYQTCSNCYDPEIVAKQLRLPHRESALRYTLRVYKRNALLRKLCWQLTDSQARLLLTKSCEYCGANPNPTIGIDRIDNSQGYTIANTVSCCNFCNHAKKDYSQIIFLNHIKRIYNYQFRDHPEREYTQVGGNMEPRSG